MSEALKEEAQQPSSGDGIDNVNAKKRELESSSPTTRTGRASNNNYYTNAKNNNNKRKSKKKKRNNHTWREEDDQFSNNNKNDRSLGFKKEVHPGSYAHPAMRELFNVTIDEHLLPPPMDSTTSPKNDDIKKADIGIKKEETGGHQAEDNCAAVKQPKGFSKKKVAFLLGYLGTGYAGFQSNEGQRTLQAEFELALLRSELLSPMNFGYFHKYSWSTSGRTDKGVHACAQVCSAKIQVLPDQSLDEIRDLINQHLPEQFRVLDVVRATRSFCAKTGRSRVRYQYMIPAYCFLDRSRLREIMLQVAPLEQEEEQRQPSNPITQSETKAILDQIRNHRISESELNSFKKALSQYEGTHTFHNFTKGLTSNDASASRYIVSFHVEDPMVFDNGMQWIPTQVVGQSFLLHQIRKMISLSLDSVRMDLPILVTRALGRESRIRTNLAPAQGLFLEMSYYDAYNQRMQSQDGFDALDWATPGTKAHDRWKTFRNEVIMDHVVKEEDKEGNFIQYLYNHEFYFDHDKNYEQNN